MRTAQVETSCCVRRDQRPVLRGPDKPAAGQFCPLPSGSSQHQCTALLPAERRSGASRVRPQLASNAAVGSLQSLDLAGRTLSLCLRMALAAHPARRWLLLCEQTLHIPPALAGTVALPLKQSLLLWHRKHRPAICRQARRQSSPSLNLFLCATGCDARRYCTASFHRDCPRTFSYLITNTMAPPESPWLASGLQHIQAWHARRQLQVQNGRLPLQMLRELSLYERAPLQPCRSLTYGGQSQLTLSPSLPAPCSCFCGRYCWQCGACLIRQPAL